MSFDRISASTSLCATSGPKAVATVEKEIVCAVCSDGDVEDPEKNAMVLCDSCDIPVHMVWSSALAVTVSYCVLNDICMRFTTLSCVTVSTNCHLSTSPGTATAVRYGRVCCSDVLGFAPAPFEHSSYLSIISCFTVSGVRRSVRGMSSA